MNKTDDEKPAGSSIRTDIVSEGTSPGDFAIWRGHDSDGSRLLTARVRADGSLGIGGQDLGKAVAVWGPDVREYEWDWELAAGDVRRAVVVLGGSPSDDPVEVLRSWAEAHPMHDPGHFLRDAGFIMRFWSRIGE